MKNINITIKGISPLLMNSFSIDGEKTDKLPPVEQCQKKLYLTPEGECYIPATNFIRAVISAAKFHKKGRASRTNDVAAALTTTNEYGIVKTPWVVDTRSVVVPATKGRIVRHRPRFDTWEVAFEFIYDDSMFSEKEIYAIFEDAGSKIGILDFRPEKKGSLGKFIITNWEVN